MGNLVRSLKPGTWCVLVNDGQIHLGLMADSTDKGCNVGVKALGYNKVERDELIMCFFPWQHVQGVWAIEGTPDWDNIEDSETEKVYTYVKTLYELPPVIQSVQHSIDCPAGKSCHLLD